MLSYISTTRRKSCGACIKAKRRCDLSYPYCSRCSTKSLACHYRGTESNDTLSQRDVSVRQESSETVDQSQYFLTPSDTNSVSSPPESDQFSSYDFESVPFSGSQYAESQIVSVCPATPQPDDPQRSHYQTPSLLAPAPQTWEPIPTTKLQVNFMVEQLSTYVRSLAYAGSTPFLHPSLYNRWEPPAYQDACAISALYILKTSRNKNTICRSISAKISTLDAFSSFWSLSDHLAAVQALIIYQIIRLFDGELDQRQVAIKDISILEKWTTELWRRSFVEAQSFPNQHQSWVFYESLRRTVLMSVFLRGAWSCVTVGICDQCPTLNHLPVTVDPRLWELEEGEWATELSARAAKSMSTYGQYSRQFNPRSSAELGGFERLLLVACRGEIAMDSMVPRMAAV